jgi:hypothetical protein
VGPYQLDFMPHPTASISRDCDDELALQRPSLDRLSNPHRCCDCDCGPSSSSYPGGGGRPCCSSCSSWSGASSWTASSLSRGGPQRGRTRTTPLSDSDFAFAFLSQLSPPSLCLSLFLYLCLCFCLRVSRDCRVIHVSGTRLSLESRPSPSSLEGSWISIAHWSFSPDHLSGGGGGDSLYLQVEGLLTGHGDPLGIDSCGLSGDGQAPLVGPLSLWAADWGDLCLSVGRSREQYHPRGRWRAELQRWSSKQGASLLCRALFHDQDLDPHRRT